jgi:hypothetical protein
VPALVPGRVREQHLLPYPLAVSHFRLSIFVPHPGVMEQKVEITIRTETVSDSPSAPSPRLESVINLVAAILSLIAATLGLIAAL